MSENDGFLVPDFWKEFSCKCGACRKSCCMGWDVGISQREYFSLVGASCSSELRSRLDEAFYVPHDASPERYALLNHNYLGDCPLRAQNGLCMLQRELGEAALPEVCRRYPRSINCSLGEATLANSCEGVIEGFIGREEPIRFERLALFITPNGDETPQRMQTRMQCVNIMQDRRLAVRYRIAAIGDFLQAGHPKNAPFAMRLPALLALAELYKEISPNIGSYCADAYEALSGCTQEDYARFAAMHDKHFPQLSLMMEHCLVNHLFYEKFPFAPQLRSAREAFIALCGVYGFLRILCVGNTPKLRSNDALVDMLCSAFRVIEHTRFESNVNAVMKRSGYGMEDADLLLML